jgi:predicted TIM-barrel fold metal-dependent hydrolase
VTEATGSAGSPDLGFIDVNGLVGPAHGQAGGADVDTLTRERRAHGIHTSLVRHLNATHSETRRGNRELLDACERDGALIPVATLLPQRSDVLDSAAEFGPKVAAFRLEGRAQPGLASAATDRLIRAAARTGRPLIVPIDTYGDASRVGAATAGLGVPVVLTGWHYNNSVDTLAAAQRYDHLHVDTSGAAHLRAIELAVQLIGAERVLFGSGAPFRAIQSSLNAILDAEISDDRKRLILGGNAARIFGLPAPTITLPDVWRPERSIDVHTHSGPLPWDVLDLPDEDLVKETRAKANGRYAVASSILAIAADLEAGNREMVEGNKTIEGRVGYLVADPTERETARDHIRRWGDAPGIVGIKVHCQWSHRVTGSQDIWNLFNILADYGKPVKIHNDGDDWNVHLLRIAREHPKLPIVIAHGGLGFPDLPGAQLTLDADNVYLEMCSSFAQVQTVRKVARIIPRHKFLYGTDTPLLDPSFVLGTYTDADIPADQRDDVFYANAARLYGLT